jgi:hypothetical protein
MEKIVKENKFGRKFTDEERKLIAELYPTHTKKQMSEIIGKEITSGALQKIKRAFHIDTKPYDEGKKIIQEMSEEIKRLAEEGWNNEDICNKLNIPLKTKYLFYKYISEFSCGSYTKTNPEIRASIIEDYSVNLLSIFDIKKKYNLDPHGIQDILKAAGVLRNFRETNRLKREAGLSKRKEKRTRHMYKDPQNPFNESLKESIKNRYDNKCQVCEIGQDNLDYSMPIHHIYPYKLCKRNEFENLIPLCKECHMDVHKFMRRNKELFPELTSIYNENKDKLSQWFLSTFKHIQSQSPQPSSDWN